MHKELTTLFTGRNRVRLGTVNSTNAYLSEFQKTGLLTEGFVVQALNQTDGRGQAGQEWLSEDGKNLLLSFIFYPDFLRISELFMLSRTFALGVVDFLRKHSAPRISIKWPNDVYCDNRKICGMLIENSVNNMQVGHTILGIGLNVNQKMFPVGLPNPVSLRQLMRTEFDLEEEFILLCESIENRYLQLQRGEQDVIRDEYDKLLYRSGEWHWYSKNGKKFRGKIIGVDSNGQLNMEMEDGKTGMFELKELAFI